MKMFSIQIPENIPVTIAGNTVPLSFAQAVELLLDGSTVFSSRQGARRSISIENALRAANGAVLLHPNDYDFLKRAAESFADWKPPVSKAMEKAGWFDLIENAAEVKKEV